MEILCINTITTWSEKLAVIKAEMAHGTYKKRLNDADEQYLRGGMTVMRLTLVRALRYEGGKEKKGKCRPT